ncbi:hypothetical protein ACSBM8_01170 [Sphingomonas sp. ASY06-1R]|uniref:hypothetical protein n=1 Tax=Sphingomonas sp. ASY06-1R TaxID=3445771 RepID=UPI003FA27D59
MSGFDIERTLWTGAPPNGIKFQAYDIVLVPFSFLWAGTVISVAVNGFVGGVRSDGLGRLDIGTCAILSFFVLMGSYMSVGRLLHDAYLRAHTRYTLTSHRILIERDGLQPRRVVIDLRQLPILDVRETRSGVGTIYFGVPSILASFFGDRWRYCVPEMSQLPALRSIPDVRRVTDMIERASRAASG